MTRAGDPERERAAMKLREHYVHGRLTLDELDERTGMALRARSTADLRRALRGLPEGPGRTLGQSVLRGAALVMFTGAWLVFSLVLLVVLALTLLIHGATLAVLAVFVLLWLVPTLLLSRLWHRTLPRRTAGA